MRRRTAEKPAAAPAELPVDSADALADALLAGDVFVEDVGDSEIWTDVLARTRERRAAFVTNGVNREV